MADSDSDELPDAPTATPVFAVPSLEGAKIALRVLLREGDPKVTATRHCAVAIDVFTRDDVLIQRALAHPEVSSRVRDAFRELTDRTISRFADAQRIDAGANTSYAHPSARHDGGASTADPYRGGFVPSNDFAGFPCGYALGAAQNRIAKLRAGLGGAGDLEIRLYAVPFLVATIIREGWLGAFEREPEEVVVLRREDGAYEHLSCDKKDWG